MISMKNTVIKKILKGIGWFSGTWIIILAAVEIFMTSSALTSLVNKVAAEFIDGELSFGKVELSMFKRFPSASIALEDFSITYPSDRFDLAEQSGPQGWLLKQGCGEESDTLASFDRFSASIRILPIITGKIKIPHVELSGPRIFAHHYSDGVSNWNIFKTSEDATEESDTTSAGLPDIQLGRISLNGKPRIVYTDSQDTLFALVNLRQMNFNGRLETKKLKNSRIGLTVDSLFLAGRTGSDTLAFGLDHLGIYEKSRDVKLHAVAKAFAATSALGRMMIPIEIKGDITMPGRIGRTVTINTLTANVASIPMKAAGELTFQDDRLSMDIDAGIEQCHLNDLLRGIAVNIIPDSRKISTNAILDFKAKATGDYIYETGSLPAITASLDIPSSEIRYEGFPDGLDVDIAINAATDDDGRLNAGIKKIYVNTRGADLKVKGRLSDLLCGDPAANIDGSINLKLDSLVTMLPDSLGVSASGTIDAGLAGTIRLSQLDMNRFSEAELTGKLTIEDVQAVYPEDTLAAFINKAEITLAPETKTSSKTGESFRMLALKGDIDSTSVTFGTLAIKGKGMSLLAMNSTDNAKSGKKGEVHRFGGRIKADRLIAASKDGMVVGINGSENGFQILPKKSNPAVPVMTLTSRNNVIFLKSDVNRVIVNNAVIGADATMNSIERKQKVKAFRDSLAKKYPGVPRDSLLFYARPAQRKDARLPEWLKEEDFRKQDINFRLDETLAKHFREWDFNGMISMEKGMLITPYFPLRNSLLGFEGHFNNNQIRIDNLGIKSGTSNLYAKGTLSGLQKILSGRGRNMLKLDVDITSDGMNANELLKAYTIGSRFSPASATKKYTEASDEEFLEIVTTDTTALDTEYSRLIVIPSNLNAEIRLNAKDIRYSDLFIDKLTANAVMKERCVQITNTSANSNAGIISFDGFYATRSKTDLQTGFNLNFKDITAEKVISLIPAVDTLMPILKSFQGKLNCEVAATAQLDTNMNLVIPSINGIMRIKGDDLAITENQVFRKLARQLLFKNKKEGHIEHMSVEGIISDSTAEIFPFIVKMDRYTLALSGIQNLDMSFKYHASIIKSPFLFKLGIDVYGDDFENWKFKIGKPKYKNAEVPVFSSVIDETKINLVKSIEDIFKKGVDAAVRSSNLDAISEHKRRLKYVRAVDQELEALSEEEQKQFEAEEAAAEAEEQGVSAGDQSAAPAAPETTQAEQKD